MNTTCEYIKHIYGLTFNPENRQVRRRGSHGTRRGNYPGSQTITTVTDDSDEEYVDCEQCGHRVPAAIYHEHLLKECPGE